MSPRDWTEVVGAAGIFLMITTVITVTIWQLAASWRAKAALVREQQYRKLAEDAVGAQDQTQRQLAALDGRLTELQGSVRAIEQVLKQVE